MSKPNNIDDLKNLYIGKSFNWLTVTDITVSYNKSGRAIYNAVCTCKCGNTKSVDLYRLYKGRIKSCGCYKHSEEFGKQHSQWYKDNPDKVQAISNRLKEFYTDNKGIVLSRNEKQHEFWKHNPDKVNSRKINARKWHDDINKAIQSAEKMSLWHKQNPEHARDSGKVYSDNCKLRRIHNTDFSVLYDYVYEEDYNKLCNGDLDSHSYINVRCPRCNNIQLHQLKNFFIIRDSKLKFNKIPICDNCKCFLTSSKYEQEIADFVSTFYCGKCIRNSRNIISPLELDLYYPEKNIAIEFNGDYWHSEQFKDKDYHYNKFKLCSDNNILLISIFEQYWMSIQNEIKNYLHNTFDGIDDGLSFNDDNSLMNNNYPNMNKYRMSGIHYDDSYVYNKSLVFTCGYTALL